MHTYIQPLHFLDMKLDTIFPQERISGVEGKKKRKNYLHHDQLRTGGQSENIKVKI